MAIAPPRTRYELPSAPIVPVTGGAVLKGESYWDLVWRQYLRNRLAVVSSLFVLVLFVIAIGAPFLADNKPIVFRGSYPGGYRDAFEEWRLGGHPEFVAQLQAMQSGAAPPNAGPPLADRLSVVERQLERLASQLPAEQGVTSPGGGGTSRSGASGRPARQPFGALEQPSHSVLVFTAPSEAA